MEGNKIKNVRKRHMYIVVHMYDVDGGIGDAIVREDVICGFPTKKEALDFADRYNNPHVYETPYDDLWCGMLEVRELNMTPPTEDGMWWFNKETWWLEQEEDYEK